MDLSQLPTTAFIDPQGRNATPTEHFLDRALQRILGLLTQAQERPIYK